MRVKGYTAFMELHAGQSFNRGLYRVHNDRSASATREYFTVAYPKLASRLVPFGFDWLGRQFAIDFGRLEGSNPLVMLLEPGSGEALEIPASFVDFHDIELVEYGEAALASEFFEAWAAADASQLPLANKLCVGYKVPLFLGGTDDLANLETVDMDVYWTLSAQLIAGIS